MTRLAPLAFVLTLAASTVAAADSYSLPWQLRPATITDSVRVDTAVAAFNDEQGNVDFASTTVLAASYQLTDAWAPMVRMGFVGNNAPGAALDGTGVANPVVGATYARRTGDVRLALTAATSMPVGTSSAKTSRETMTARPADEAMFAVDSMTEIIGVDVAYVNRGFTAQAEATLMPSLRVRGDSGDRLRTAAAVGMHLGYFLGSHVSLGADARYQDALAVALGARLHVHVGRNAVIHPGLSLSHGATAPLLSAEPATVQLDVPVTF